VAAPSLTRPTAGHPQRDRARPVRKAAAVVFQAGTDACPLAAWLDEFTDTHPRVRVRIVRIPETGFAFEPGTLDVVIAASAGVGDGPHRAGGPLVRGRGDPGRRSEASAGRLDGAARVAGRRLVRGDADRLVDPAGDRRPVRRRGLAREVVFESEDWTMVLDLVRTRQTLAFVPSELAESSGLPLVQIEGVRLTRRVELVTPRGAALSPVARAFSAHVLAKRAAVIA
jgi:DNA-binding transcriptional LysR family regulator